MNTQHFLKFVFLVFASLNCHSPALFGQEAKFENDKIITDPKDLVEGIAKSEIIIAWDLLKFPMNNPSNFSIPSSIEEINKKQNGLQFLMKVSGSNALLPKDIIIVKKTEDLTEPSNISIEPFEPFHSIKGSYWYFTRVVLLPIGSEIGFEEDLVNFYGIGFSNGKILIDEQGIKVIKGTLISKNLDQQEQQTQTETYKIGISSTEIDEIASEEEAGKKFLDENKKKQGVVTTASGLQYEVIQVGDGPKPGPSDKVTVHYHGTLLDGTIFDSSVDRGQPATFGVTQVIQGWEEGLQLMQQGAKWRLFIPSQLAYGERGAGKYIKPYSVLIFELELLEIIRK